MKQKTMKKLIIAVCCVALVGWIVLMVNIFGGESKKKPAKTQETQPTETATPTPTREPEESPTTIYRPTKIYYRENEEDEVLLCETTYDEKGKPLSFVQYDVNTGTADLTTNFEYDDNGDLVRMVQFNCEYTFRRDAATGMLYMRCEHFDPNRFSYTFDKEAVFDADGRVLLTAEWYEPMEEHPNPFDVDEMLIRATNDESRCYMLRYYYSADGRRTGFGEWENYWYYDGTYEYADGADNDHPSSLTRYYEERVCDITKYTYTEDGQPLSEINYRFSDYESCYDERGRLREQVKNDPQYIGSEQVFEYDRDGVILSELQRSKGYSYYSDDAGNKYDETIFWVQQKWEYSNLENGNRSVKEIRYNENEEKWEPEKPNIYEYDKKGNLLDISFVKGGTYSGYTSQNWGYRFEYEKFDPEKGDYDGDALQREMIRKTVDQRVEYAEAR